jgi:hypothetical protein
VVRELFRELQPAGYRHLALEISPPMATVLDGKAREGLPKVASFQEYRPEWRSSPSSKKPSCSSRPGPPFPIKSQCSGDWTTRSRPTASSSTACVARLRRGPAKAAAEALHEKSAAAWKTVSETKNPGAFFSFSTAPDVLPACGRPSRTSTPCSTPWSSATSPRPWISRTRRAWARRGPALPGRIHADRPAPPASHLLHGEDQEERSGAHENRPRLQRNPCPDRQPAFADDVIVAAHCGSSALLRDSRGVPDDQAGEPSRRKGLPDGFAAPPGLPLSAIRH